MAKRRKVGNLLALAVLVLAAERPMHPYEMATTLRERGKDQSIKINWGSLYTVVQNLERHGFIQATETAREGRRPERTLYAITDAGWVELRDWIQELIGSPDKEYRRFEAALAELPVLHPDEATGLLAQREQALRERIADRERQLATVGRRIGRLFLIESEYELVLLRAEADWVAALVAELEGGTFPGQAAWREYHDAGLPVTDFAEVIERGEAAAETGDS